MKKKNEVNNNNDTPGKVDKKIKLDTSKTDVLNNSDEIDKIDKNREADTNISDDLEDNADRLKSKDNEDDVSILDIDFI